MPSVDFSRKLPAYADVIYDVLSFAGGMNTRASQLFLGRDALFALRKDQAPLIVNLVRNSSGALQTRPGRVKLNVVPVVPPAGDSVIRSLFELRTQTGTNVILMNAGNSVYKLVGTTWSSIGTVPTSNQRMLWTQFHDVALGINGADEMVSYDGTSFATVTGAPTNGSAIVSHRNRVWIVTGRTLRYSALGNHADWSTPNNAGALPIPTTRGRGGTALISLWDRLIVFTSDQVFQVLGTGPSTFAIEPINLQYGHELSPYGVVAAGNDIYYGSQQGCHSLSIDYSQSVTGDVSYDYVSGVIEPTWQDIDKGNLPNVFAVHDSSRNLLIYLCNRSGTQNTEALVADYYHLDARGRPTWSLYANMPFACGAEVVSINNTREVIFGSYDGYVYRQDLDSFQDDGSDISIQLQYITDLELPAFSKLWRHVLLFASSTAPEALTGTITYDFGALSKGFDVGLAGVQGNRIGSTFTIGVSPLGTADYQQHRVSIAGHGRFATIYLAGSVSSRVSIGGMIFYAGIRRAIHH
jgi:hypothetical protein